MAADPAHLKPSVTRCPVLFDDGPLILVNKPSGLLSHPNPLNNDNKSMKPKAAAFEGIYDFNDRRFDTPEGPVWLIHRLDQDASGVLLAARNRQAAKECRKAFEQLEVLKVYQVLVAGMPAPPKGKWKDHIVERRGRGAIRCQIQRHGKKNAELLYTVRQFYRKANMALLEIQLLTGRTHQIRTQCAFHKHPIAGDGVYGNFLWNRKLKKSIGLRRMFLHAAVLSIRHPSTGNLIRVEAPLPEVLATCLKSKDLS